MQTKAQRLKQKKAKDRQKEIQKRRHLLRNAPPKRYRLDVKIDDSWRVVREWSNLHQVEAHRIDTENRRAKGEEIVQGRVYDSVDKKVILEIPASVSKGSAPDKIANGPVAKDFEVKVEADVDPAAEPAVK